MELPGWAQWVLASAAVVTALGVLWTKTVKPLLEFAKKADERLATLDDLTSTFRDTPHAFAVLDEIVSEFRSDSGSTLRDSMNRLEEAVGGLSSAAEALRIRAASTSELAGDDRLQLARVLVALDRIVGDMAAGQARADAAGTEPGESADAAAMSPEGKP